MEYISSFTYCDTIQTEMTPQGPQQQIVKPLQVLTPIAIPGNFRLLLHVVLRDLTHRKKIVLK